MKTKLLRGWRWMLAVACTGTLLGCLDQTRGTSAQTIVEPSAAAVEPTPADEPVETPAIHVVIPPATLSPGLAEVVKLAQSGVSEEVLLAYIEKSNHAFNPSVDEIVYLKDIGISDAAVALMVRQQNTEPTQITSSSVTIENRSVAEPAQNVPATPSLSEPPAPSYSVNAEANYNETSSAEPPQQVTINYFESTLSPYGNWIDVPDYGRCWQPTVVVINKNWRPYADRGRWLYTSHGWYWQSDYSWGWAPFHYGRWHCDSRIGWVWVPGSTWGPAWVSWRYTDGYCGWAPLPPSAHYRDGFYYRNSRVGISFDFGLHFGYYTFIPSSRFCDRTPSRYYVSGSHSKTIYNNSVVINNYIRGNNNTIINEGVGKERIARATQTPIRTVSLRELPASSNPVGRAERLEGNSLTVFRPNVSAPAATRSATQRSVAPASTLTQSPTATTTSRNLRSITKTESPSVAPVDPMPAAVAPVDPTPAPKSPTRTVSPSTVARPSPAPVVAPNPATIPAQKSSPRSIVTTPNVSTPRSIPTQTPPQQIGRTVERSEVNIAPMEVPRSAVRTIPTSRPSISSVRETPSAPVVRSLPNVAPVQQPQPTVRETRRPETPSFNSGFEQRTTRSIPTPAPAAPAPVFNSREISRPSQIERPAPQVIQPRVSAPAPAPSVRPSAPRQETPAARPQIERSVERGRSERRN